LIGKRANHQLLHTVVKIDDAFIEYADEPIYDGFVSDFDTDILNRVSLSDFNFMIAQ